MFAEVATFECDFSSGESHACLHLPFLVYVGFMGQVRFGFEQEIVVTVSSHKLLKNGKIQTRYLQNKLSIISAVPRSSDGGTTANVTEKGSSNK